MANCPECQSGDYTPHWIVDDLDFTVPELGEHMEITVYTGQVCFNCTYSKDNEPITLKLTPENIERVIDASTND